MKLGTLRRVACTAALAVALGPVRLAVAQDSRPKLTEQQKQQTREHFEKAKLLYDVRKFDEAIAEYERAYLISADPAMLYNIAQCHRQANRPEQAASFYRNYLRNAPGAPNRSEVEKRIAEMEKLAEEQRKRGTAPVTPGPPPSRPTTAPPPVTTAPTTPGAPPSSPVAPPPVVATATAPNPVTPAIPEVAPSSPSPSPPPWSTTPSPPPASSAGAPIPLPTLPPPMVPGSASADPGPSAPPSHPADQPEKQMLPYALLIGGGTLVVTSMILGAVAVGRAKEVESRARSRAQFDADVKQIESQGKAASFFAVLTGLVGVAAGGTGIYYLMRSGSIAPADSSASAPRAMLVPVAAPGFAGGEVRVSF